MRSKCHCVRHTVHVYIPVLSEETRQRKQLGKGTSVSLPIRVFVWSYSFGSGCVGAYLVYACLFLRMGASIPPELGQYRQAGEGGFV